MATIAWPRSTGDAWSESGRRVGAGSPTTSCPIGGRRQTARHSGSGPDNQPWGRPLNSTVFVVDPQTGRGFSTRTASLARPGRAGPFESDVQGAAPVVITSFTSTRAAGAHSRLTSTRRLETGARGTKTVTAAPSSHPPIHAYCLASLPQATPGAELNYRTSCTVGRTLAWRGAVNGTSANELRRASRALGGPQRHQNMRQISIGTSAADQPALATKIPGYSRPPLNATMQFWRFKFWDNRAIPGGDRGKGVISWSRLNGTRGRQ